MFEYEKIREVVMKQAKLNQSLVPNVMHGGIATAGAGEVGKNLYCYKDQVGRKIRYFFLKALKELLQYKLMECSQKEWIQKNWLKSLKDICVEK